MSPRCVLQPNLSRFTNRKWTSSLVFNIRICQKPPNSSLIICCYVTDSVWWNVLREHTGNCSLVLRGNQRWYLRRQPDIKYDRYDCCHSLMIHSCRECPCHDNCTTPCNKLVTAGFIYSYTYHWHCVELFHPLLYTTPPSHPPPKKTIKQCSHHHIISSFLRFLMAGKRRNIPSDRDTSKTSVIYALVVTLPLLVQLKKRRKCGAN